MDARDDRSMRVMPSIQSELASTEHETGYRQAEVNHLLPGVRRNYILAQLPKVGTYLT